MNIFTRSCAYTIFLITTTIDKMKFRYLAFIPVRGGSKGIPGKNIKMIAGKPLVCHCLDAALESSFIDKVIVSTDCEKIKNTIHTYYGKNDRLIIFNRDKETATDTASTESAMLDFVNKSTYTFDNIVLIQATSPLITPDDLNQAIIQYEKNSLGGLISVVRQRRFIWNSHGPENYDPQNRPRRQEYDGYLVENGAFYITSRQKLLDTKCRVSLPYGVYEMDSDSYYEIDEPSDWHIVEKLLLGRKKKNIIPFEVEAVVLDFDGVFTDNKVVVHQDGTESVLCDRGDGMGIEMLKRSGIQVWVLSKEQNPVLTARCKKLNIPCFYGINDKWTLLQKQLNDKNIDKNKVVYVGNDINDLECMQNVGCGVAVADAYPEVKEIADIILLKTGGNGAIRELANTILLHKSSID